MDPAQMIRELEAMRFGFSSMPVSASSHLEEVGWSGPGKKGWRKRGSEETMVKGDVFRLPGEKWDTVRGLDGNPVGRHECWTKEEGAAECNVKWDDVIGLETAKAELQEALEAPYKHADIFEAFGMKPAKGVLLYGPPGCGKTMLGKAAATAMAKVHGKKTAEGFFYFNGADMYGKHVGDEQKWVREAFKKGEDFYKRAGYPATLFFDECDSMLPDRNFAPRYAVDGVNTFLSLMDGMSICNSFILLATNNHHRLDAAAIREGRIDRKIFVGPPDRNAVEAILVSAFMGKPLPKGASPASFATLGAERLFHESALIGEEPLSAYLNGANVTGIASRAAGFAFRNALELRKAGVKLAEKEMWISVSHLEQAVRALQQEIREMILRTPATAAELKIDHKIQISEDRDEP